MSDIAAPLAEEQPAAEPAEAGVSTSTCGLSTGNTRLSRWRWPSCSACSGDFGPVPTLVKADVQLARSGHIEQYLEARDPGHTLHLVTIWLYDHPKMLNDAVANGLTDDQWGMVKERDYNVGPWYLIIPAIIHVEFPNGVTGTGFVLWNLLVALLFIFALPLVPGVRSLPRLLRLHRLIVRRPTPGEQIPPDPSARLHPVSQKDLEEEGIA